MRPDTEGAGKFRLHPRKSRLRLPSGLLLKRRHRGRRHVWPHDRASNSGGSATHFIIRGDALAGVVGVGGDMENVSQAL
jgi:hypothetical protein